MMMNEKKINKKTSSRNNKIETHKEDDPVYIHFAFMCNLIFFYVKTLFL